MFNWSDFDKIFNEMFSNRTGFNFGDNNWDKRTYKSPDGSFSMTYITKKNNSNPNLDEVDILKHKLEIAVEEQNFELAVELRDKIKNLEKNLEKISELQSKLDECIKNQDFEKAIDYRDQIKSLK